ncbi:hypothetical protein ACFYXS_09005 [Streptomyces sp. NPDC002574]|uniref:hypothetical protein n=1 Tax=Streptomyces sp. NPDC002574 TaxID=3364652 RepID=UPI0036BDF80E
MTVPEGAGRPPSDAGPAQARRELTDWAGDSTAPGLCLVTGARGTGKSRLLAWYFTGTAPDPARRVHALVPAAGLTAEVFCWELGRQLGYGALGAPDILRRMDRDTRPVLLAVADLHRAAGTAPQEIVRGLLDPLVSLPHVRLLAEVADSGAPAWSQPCREVALTGSGDAPQPVDAAAESIRMLAAVPLGPAGTPDWEQAPDEVRAGVLEHALAGGTAARLTGDPGFLVHGPAPAITAALADPRTPAPRGLRAVWRRAAPALTALGLTGPERAAVLHTAALSEDPKLAAYLEPLARRHAWTALWAVTEPAAALGLGADGLLVADPVGRLSVLDPAAGAVRSRVPLDAALRPAGIAVAEGGGLLLLDADETLHPAGPMSNALSRVADLHNTTGTPPTAVTAHGRRVAVGDADGRVHVWDAAAHDRGPVTRRLHPAPLTAAALVHAGGSGLALCLSGGADGTLRLWETGSDPMPEPVDRREAVVTALAAADTPSGPVVAAAWSDGEVHLWDLFAATRRVLTPPFRAAALALTPGATLFVGGAAGVAALDTRPAAP